jgi:hypothetical protein
MHITILRPPPHPLPPKPEYHTTPAEERNERHICHDSWNITRLFGPRRNELRESIAPDIFVHGNSDENSTRDGFVRVDSVCAVDGGEGGDLDASASVPDYNDDLRIELVLAILAISTSSKTEVRVDEPDVVQKEQKGN